MVIIIGEEEEIYLEDQVGILEETFWTKALAPKKKTLLHDFLESWESLRWESFFKMIDPSEDFGTLERYIESCDLKKPDWLNIELIDDYKENAEALVDSAIPKAANAAFQLLFQDRRFLLKFHSILSETLREADPKDFPESASLPIPRCSYTPTWLKKGIFHRDKGLCQNCARDITGLLNLQGEIHLDHLRPLYSGGTNDASNFQLLCKECNLSKGGSSVAVQNINHTFW